MSSLIENLSGPRAARYIRFVLDECLPPVLRDRRWFYGFVQKAYNPKLDPDFKAKAPRMGGEEFRRAYEDLVPMRSTDLTPGAFRFVLENVAGKSVLEVGCGNGRVSLACAQAGFDVTATDLAEGNLRQVRVEAGSLGLSLRTEIADVGRLGFPDASFDCVICLHTLEHVLDLPSAIAELKRVARERLIIVVPRERYHRYTCNYHLHFFGGPEQLILAFGLERCRCRSIEGALCYVGELGLAPETRLVPAESWASAGPAPAIHAGHRVLAMFPFFNEEGKLAEMAPRLRPGLVDKFVGVNDGSTDGGPRLLREQGIEVLDQPHTGAGAAIKRAVRYAQEHGFDILVVMAGNDKDDPEEIPRLLGPIVEGDSDYVQGSRFLVGGGYPNLPIFRLVAIKFLSLLFSLYTRRRCTELTNGFRAYRIDLFSDPRIDVGQEWLDGYEYEYYLHWKVHAYGYRTTEVPVTKSYPASRKSGYSKIRPITGWWQMLRPFVLLTLRIKR